MKFFDGQTGEILDSEVHRDKLVNLIDMPHRLCKLSDDAEGVIKGEFGGKRDPEKRQRAHRNMEARQAALAAERENALRELEEAEAEEYEEDDFDELPDEEAFAAAPASGEAE